MYLYRRVPHFYLKIQDPSHEIEGSMDGLDANLYGTVSIIPTVRTGRRLGGDVSVPSQSQSSQPILPTVVVPSPPAILTDPEAEEQDEDLELPTLVQEETKGSPSKKQKTGKKKKKPDDNDESPEHSPRHDPASSSNYNPNNPANLPVQYESEEELIPHVPTSSGTGSSERTMRYTDQEMEIQKTLRGPDPTMITKLISF